MTFTDILLSNYKAEIRVNRFNHQSDENIILKFETNHGLSSVFLNEEQARELQKKLYETLTGYEPTSRELEFTEV